MNRNSEGWNSCQLIHSNQNLYDSLCQTSSVGFWGLIAWYREEERTTFKYPFSAKSLCWWLNVSFSYLEGVQLEMVTMYSTGNIPRCDSGVLRISRGVFENTIGGGKELGRQVKTKSQCSFPDTHNKESLITSCIKCWRQEIYRKPGLSLKMECWKQRVCVCDEDKEALHTVKFSYLCDSWNTLFFFHGVWNMRQRFEKDQF